MELRRGIDRENWRRRKESGWKEGRINKEVTLDTIIYKSSK